MLCSPEDRSCVEFFRSFLGCEGCIRLSHPCGLERREYWPPSQRSLTPRTHPPSLGQAHSLSDPQVLLPGGILPELVTGGAGPSTAGGAQHRSAPVQPSV